jgi:hypothetical protein
MDNPVSSCCGSPNVTIDFDTGVDYEDLGLCPDCKEHCEFVEEEDE